MRYSRLFMGLAAGLASRALLVAAQSPTESGVQQPTEPPRLDAPTTHGCYNSSGDLEKFGNVDFNTIGECNKKCLTKNPDYLVSATQGGQFCWCGFKYPPASSLVDPKQCNVGCTGFQQHACGGLNAWTVYITGVQLAVQESDPKPSTSSSSQAASATDTAAASKSATASAGSGSGQGASSQTIGIAVGVVIAVLIVAGGIGGIFFYMRRKRNKEIEEEHRRNAAVNAFINGSQPPSNSGSITMTDSRLDPVMAHRRLSDGSIADNQDYSRKILRVTNA